MSLGLAKTPPTLRRRFLWSWFAPTTWESFRRCAIEGLPAEQVAAEMGLSVNAVTLAKSRILKRLREEAGDLLK